MDIDKIVKFAIAYNDSTSLENILWDGNAPSSAPANAKPINTPPSAQVTSQPTNTIWKAPIHGSWANSGGFTHQANPTHPTGHMGIDMRAPAGTPIYSLGAGTVTNVETNAMGGNTVNIEHANGVKSYYAHLSTVSVHKGDKVTTETEIGTVGNSGNASKTFPHLHLQIWQNGQLTDPTQFFSAPAYTNLSNEEKRRGPWLSEYAKRQAANFNMKNHIANV